MSLFHTALACSLLVTVASACQSTEPIADAGPAPSVVPVVATALPTEPAASTQAADPVQPAGGNAAPKAAASATTSVDAGVSDAGTAQQCCCEAAGYATESAVMSECSKTRKGQCVSKTKCSADASAPAPAPAAKDAGSAEQTCCCSTGGAVAVVGMSTCTKGGKGQCVKAAECKK